MTDEYKNYLSETLMFKVQDVRYTVKFIIKIEF